MMRRLFVPFVLIVLNVGVLSACGSAPPHPTLLAGKGVAASTPVPAVLDSYVEPAAQFRHDPAEAGRILDAAGGSSVRTGSGPATAKAPGSR